MATVKRSISNGWICAAEQLPSPGVTFVVTGLHWKDRQYVVKKQWTAPDQKGCERRLSTLYWLPLPPLPKIKEQ